MNWIKQDWEHEAALDAVYAQERQLLIEQEYFEYESKERNPAKITYKKHGNKNNTSSLSRVDKKRTQLRYNIFTKASRRKNKH